MMHKWTGEQNWRDKRGKVTPAEWSATCGLANEGVKQSRAVCSELLLAAGHRKPLGCDCDGDRQTEQSFLKQAVE